MANATVLSSAQRTPARRHAEGALEIASRLPRIVLEARRVAAASVHGVHGRRRAGPGEAFWQFRPFSQGEPANRIDWRRSARDDRTFVREREWEASHAIMLWTDLSASMGFKSDLAAMPKIDRALVAALSLADLLVRAGERVGLLGGPPPSASRAIIDRLADTLAHHEHLLINDMPPSIALPPLAEAVLIGDFFADPKEIVQAIEAISSRGARGHVITVTDPVEEIFPYSGHAEIFDLEIGARLRVGDAAAFRKQYLERLDQHRSLIRDACRRRGWSFTIHRTDRPASDAVLGVMTHIANGRRDGRGY
ncbi:MAG: DUF58 domain-containing protein [Beijerinckiaceae bacterium]